MDCIFMKTPAISKKPKTVRAAVYIDDGGTQFGLF
jgi:hypothetical protein